MTAVGTVPVDRFEHEAMFYRGDADFLAGLLPFVRDGLEQDEAVVIAEPRPRLDMLRDALGTDAAAVELLDMAEIGANPARIIAVWAAVLEKHTGAGRRLRGVGEPAFPGRRTAELVECRLHELLLNAAFDDGPGWRLAPWLLHPVSGFEVLPLSTPASTRTPGPAGGTNTLTVPGAGRNPRPGSSPLIRNSNEWPRTAGSP